MIECDRLTEQVVAVPRGSFVPPQQQLGVQAPPRSCLLDSTTTSGIYKHKRYSIYIHGQMWLTDHLR